MSLLCVLWTTIMPRVFPQAHEIVDKFFEADMSTIRNKTAYFIGVLKRYRGPNSQASGGAQPAGGVQPAAAVPDWSAYANMFQANMLMLQGSLPPTVHALHASVAFADVCLILVLSVQLPTVQRCLRRL